MQIIRNRQRKLCRGLSRIFYGIRRQKSKALDFGFWAFPSDRNHCRQDIFNVDVRSASSARSRGVRWDSDHVVVSDDATLSAMQEVVPLRRHKQGPYRHGFLRRQHKQNLRMGDWNASRPQMPALRFA
ncbi:MAG: L-rhamnose isomerase [Bacilli bacterium]